MDNTSQYLNGYNIRPSVHRLAIMRYLQKNRTHPTAEEVFEALKDEMPTLSKTTVYNTLRLFIAHGAAQYVGIDDKNARFDGIVEPHAHFRCKKCGKIVDLPVGNFNELIPKDFRGRIEESHLYFRGLCEDCKANSDN